MEAYGTWICNFGFVYGPCESMESENRNESGNETGSVTWSVTGSENESRSEGILNECEILSRNRMNRCRKTHGMEIWIWNRTVSSLFGSFCIPVALWQSH